MAEWALKVRALAGQADLGDCVTVIGRNSNFSKAEDGETPDAWVYGTVSVDAMRSVRTSPTAGLGSASALHTPKDAISTAYSGPAGANGGETL